MLTCTHLRTTYRFISGDVCGAVVLRQRRHSISRTLFFLAQNCSQQGKIVVCFFWIVPLSTSTYCVLPWACRGRAASKTRRNICDAVLPTDRVPLTRRAKTVWVAAREHWVCIIRYVIYAGEKRAKTEVQLNISHDIRCWYILTLEYIILNKSQHRYKKKTTGL